MLKIVFWEEEYCLAHCTVGEVITLPPGMENGRGRRKGERKVKTREERLRLFWGFAVGVTSQAVKPSHPPTHSVQIL